MLLDKNSPKIRKNEHIRQTKSPAHQETVIAQMISSGIRKKVTWKLRKYTEINMNLSIFFIHNLDKLHRIVNLYPHTVMIKEVLLKICWKYKVHEILLSSHQSISFPRNLTILLEEEHNVCSYVVCKFKITLKAVNLEMIEMFCWMHLSSVKINL